MARKPAPRIACPLLSVGFYPRFHISVAFGRDRVECISSLGNRADVALWWRPALLGLQAQPHAAKRQRATDQMDHGRRFAKKDNRQHGADDRPEIEAQGSRHRAELRAE